MSNGKYIGDKSTTNTSGTAPINNPNFSGTAVIPTLTYAGTDLGTTLNTKSGLTSANIFTGTNSFQSTVFTKGLLYEASLSASGSASPFTLNYSLGGIFYIPTASVPSSNFSVIITNIPVDQNNVYTLSLLYYQASTSIYCNTLRVVDTTGTTYILGTSSTYASPLNCGGTPLLTTSPSLIIQQFTIISISSVRRVLSSVGSYY